MKSLGRKEQYKNNKEKSTGRQEQYKNNKEKNTGRQEQYKSNKEKNTGRQEFRGREELNRINKHSDEESEDLVIGRNAVTEAIKGDRTVEAIYISKGHAEGSINAIIGMAKEKKLVIKEVDRKKLDSMSGGSVHQGIIARVTPYKYCEVADILNLAKEKDEAPFIIILDEIEDPHNLGSIIRTAELCGVHGVIIPKRRNVGITSTVYKSSVGAVEHVKVAKVTNINVAIDELKSEGIWVYGADIAGEEYSYEVNFSGPCALIIGSEGRGISKLTLKKCDKLVKIPMVGKINSLNASVAGGIMMYEILKGRLK